MSINIPNGLKVAQRIFKYFEIDVDFRVNNTLTDRIDGTIDGDNSNIYKGVLSFDKIPEKFMV